MANWVTIEFKFDIFEPLKAPLEGALQALEVIEAILETLLAVLRPFLLDVLNPLKAIVQLILAAIRAIINQIESSGFSILLVHPDFNNPDFAAVLNSVSGAYPGFESKVYGKFFDSSDIFRPQYPAGSTVGMLIFYIGANSPGDLLGLLFNLLSLIKHPIKFQGLPAPVDLKVLPIRQGGDTIAQFSSLFSDNFEQQLSLEWRMPQQAGGGGATGLFNQLSGLYNQFRFPNFIIERQGPFPQEQGESEKDPRGDIIKHKIESQTLGPKNDALTKRFDFPTVISDVSVREDTGAVYRKFDSRRAIIIGSDGTTTFGDTGSSDGIPISNITSSTPSLVRGIATGKYKFVDNDLKFGKTYYYRVRAFFGDASAYISADESNIITKGNQAVFKFSDMTLGQPSNVVKGFCPRQPTDKVKTWNMYEDLSRAIQAGILLNFELPKVYPQNNQLSSPVDGSNSSLQEDQAGALIDFPENTSQRNVQRTGWGTLGQIGNQIGSIKAFVKNSEELRNNIVFQATCRRLTNSVLETINTNAELQNVLATKWNTIKFAIDQLETDSEEGRTWGFVGIINGISSDSAAKIDAYLALEDDYLTTGIVNGPVPTGDIQYNRNQPTGLSIQTREEIADFLRIALSVNQANNSYLAWYSVTVGDLFPDLVPFMFDFEQWILALLKALNSAIQEIADIIETLLSQIRALEQILITILQIIDILEVSVDVSVLVVGPTTNGSAATLAQELITSEDKPDNSPFGLHSGMVMTFGGPGQGSVAALNALKFVLGLQFL